MLTLFVCLFVFMREDGVGVLFCLLFFVVFPFFLKSHLIGEMPMNLVK